MNSKWFDVIGIVSILLCIVGYVFDIIWMRFVFAFIGGLWIGSIAVVAVLSWRRQP